jgi:hypothetical protein
MMSVPGVGPATAVRFVAAIDDVSRFPTAHEVQSYLGLTPGERSSSNKKRRTGITKESEHVVRAPVKARVVLPVQVVPTLIAALQEQMRIYTESAGNAGRGDPIH